MTAIGVLQMRAWGDTLSPLRPRTTMPTRRLPHGVHISLARQSSTAVPVPYFTARLGGIRLELVAAIRAPHDEPHAGCCSAAERQRQRWLGFHPSRPPVFSRPLPPLTARGKAGEHLEERGLLSLVPREFLWEG